MYNEITQNEGMVNQISPYHRSTMARCTPHQSFEQYVPGTMTTNRHNQATICRTIVLVHAQVQASDRHDEGGLAGRLQASIPRGPEK
jgi:hypothetical protein